MSLRLSKNSVNIGDVKAGTTKTILVDIVNPTNANIPITEIRTSCGSCTKAHVNGKTFVPANGSLQMTVTFTGKADKVSKVGTAKSVTINKQLIFTFTSRVVI